MWVVECLNIVSWGVRGVQGGRENGGRYVAAKFRKSTTSPNASCSVVFIKLIETKIRLFTQRQTRRRHRALD